MAVEEYRPSLEARLEWVWRRLKEDEKAKKMNRVSRMARKGHSLPGSMERGAVGTARIYIYL